MVEVEELDDNDTTVDVKSSAKPELRAAQPSTTQPKSSLSSWHLILITWVAIVIGRIVIGI